MKDYLSDLLDQALILAQNKSPENGGMASVKIVYHPYECYWIAEADYSNNFKIQGEGCESKEISVLNLIEELKEI